MSSPPPGSPHAGTWQPPSVEDMQALLPHYQFEFLLGRGGMGAVYKATQLSLDRPVAIKVLPGGCTGSEKGEYAERFKNEARTMAKMHHPSIVNVFDFGQTASGLLYFVMEYVDGTDVAQIIHSQGRLPEEHALSVTAHVCDALAYAHARGIIHRDIKPANILINRDGQVKVADFGLAKQSDSAGFALTKTSVAMGTPDYVAPEALVHGFPLDGRADLYAIGVMLYNMLTGEIPRGMWVMPAKKVGTDPRFDAIIAKAMQTDREERYRTASEIRLDLHAIQTLPRAVIIQQQQDAAEAAAKATRAADQATARRAAAARVHTRPSSSSIPVPPKQKPKRTTWIWSMAAVLLLAGGIYRITGQSSAPLMAPSVATLNLSAREQRLRAPLAAGQIDALASVKAGSAGIFAWSPSATGLELKATRSPGIYKGTVELPTPPALSYAVDAWFTVPQTDAVGITIPVGDGHATTCWISTANGGVAGLGKVDGNDPQTAASGHSTSFELVANELTQMRIEVRRTPGQVDIRFHINGAPMAAYQGEPSRLTTSTAWQLSKNRALIHLGGVNVTFHRVTMADLDGDGTSVPPGS
ncbi:serine/threonine-protein kinase [Brevifollis gellanilyticus]|nr:serine/threonine-protein kinase [Brevifollis gellanilyticus]